MTRTPCTSPHSSIYDISVTAIEGMSVSMSEFKGKVLLIVNLASEWRLSNTNYQQLVEVYKKYSSQGLEILGFPCNQFNSREPGNDKEIEAFARSKGANFKIFSKTKVNGDEACELYKFLRAHSNLKGDKVDWNLAKFVVNRDGSVIEYYESTTEPYEVAEHLRKYL